MRFSALFAAAALAASSALAATTCNGDASLCTKLYSNVTFVGAHDSYAVGTGSFDNQDKDVTAQLVSAAARQTGACLAKTSRRRGRAKR